MFRGQWNPEEPMPNPTPLRAQTSPSAPAAVAVHPPRELGLHGRVLWDDILREFRIEDRAGLELLTLACEALDRAERLARQINEDGEVVKGSAGMMKEHPGLRSELQNRAFVARTLERLGLNLEAVKPVGRPPRVY
jgi:hypothetical protein